MGSERVPQFDISQLLSERSKLWRPSNIRTFIPLEHTPGMCSLLAGKPHPETFPIESITMKVKSPSSHIDSNADSNQDKANGTVPKADEITIEGRALEEALQYGITGGMPSFVKLLEQFQSYLHKSDKEAQGWQISVGSGSQDLLTKAFQVLINEGDAVLVETPAYPCAEGYFNLLLTGTDSEKMNAAGLPAPPSSEIVSVTTDGHGLCPDNLRGILSEWSKTHPNQKLPKVLYTVPTGSNPTGATIPEARKIQVLKLAKQYNFIIMEDDAYSFLYYGSEGSKPQSYFALEKEANGEVGRVIRFDSLSKILSSGMRIGFMTAPAAICKYVDLYTSNTNLQCSSTTQAMALALLSQWKIEGFLEHCRNVANFYRQRRDVFEKIAHKHLDGVATWTSPVAGMFLFIRMNLSHDGENGDSFKVIREQALKKGVLAVPGASFMPPGSQSAFVRCSFSQASEDVAEEAFRRLRGVIDDARGG